jgi:hypothetical protein
MSAVRGRTVVWQVIILRYINNYLKSITYNQWSLGSCTFANYIKAMAAKLLHSCPKCINGLQAPCKTRVVPLRAVTACLKSGPMGSWHPPREDRAGRRKQAYRGLSMTLANMRENRVRSLSVTCKLCHHAAVVNADGFADLIPIPAFGPRMICTSCGGLPPRRPDRPKASGALEKSPPLQRLIGGSSNGRTTDSDSVNLGSNPSPPATKLF